MLAIPLLLIGTFLCLFPLSLYCLFLAGLNHRPRPTRVAGTWDFAWVLVATAGFWIVGGPAILAGLHESWRRLLVRGSFASIREYLDTSSVPWLLLWSVYFAAVVVGGAWLIWRRRSVTVIYHIDPDQAHAAVATALDRLGWSWARFGPTYSIGIPTGKATAISHGPGDAATGRALLDVSPAPGLRSVTLLWRIGGRRHRDGFEAELDRVLDDVRPPENPAVGWLLTVATVLFSLMLFCAGLFALFVWNLRT